MKLVNYNKYILDSFIKDLSSEQHGRAELGKKYGFSAEFVSKFAINFRFKKLKNKLSKSELKSLKTDILSKKYTIPELAEKYNVDSVTISNKKRKFNLKGVNGKTKHQKKREKIAKYLKNTKETCPKKISAKFNCSIPFVRSIAKNNNIKLKLGKSKIGQHNIVQFKADIENLTIKELSIKYDVNRSTILAHKKKIREGYYNELIR